MLLLNGKEGIYTTKGCSSVSAVITRPANTDPYTGLDCIGNTGTAANRIFSNVATKTGAYIMIRRAWIRVDINAVPAGMSGFYLHLYNASPTAIADNAAYDLPEADRAKYLGNIYIPTPDDLGSTLFSSIKNIEAIYKLSTTSLYAMLVTAGGFTPAANSEVYNVGMDIEEV